MKDKSSKNFWNKIAKFYAPLMEKDKSLYKDICEKIHHYLNNNMDVLELACGSGQLSFQLSKYTKSWLATDFSEKMILEAKKHQGNTNLSFSVEDANKIPFKDNRFDCVVIANALHIIPDTDKVMNEIKRVLKNGGILCAPTFLWEEKRPKKIIEILMSLTGFKMYKKWNKETFKSFIEKHGFSFIEMNLIYGGVVPVGVMIAKKIFKKRLQLL